MKKVFKNPLFYLSVVLIIAVGFTVFSLVRAADTFKEPTKPFPLSDVEAPIDESANPQTKKGFLTLSDGLCLSNSTYDDNKPCKRYWTQFVNDVGESFYLKEKVYSNTSYASLSCNGGDVIVSGGCYLSNSNYVLQASAPRGDMSGWYCYTHKDCFKDGDCHTHLNDDDKTTIGIRVICLDLDR